MAMNSTEHADAEQFRSIIAARLGLQFSDDKLEMLADVLQHRLQSTGKASASGYFSSFKSGGEAREELRVLASQLTISETYFFRAPDHFHALSEVALPERMRLAGNHSPVRILSAGCASGDEAYSIAIVLREHLPQLSSMNAMILGIDINPAMLTKARQGEYSEWSLRETAAELRQRYFHGNNRTYLLDERIRSMARFEEGNIALDDRAAWDRGSYDIIFCRNVIMYLVPEAARAAVARLTRALVPGGFLFLSHAETLRGISQDFHLRHTHDTFYYQKRDDAGAEPAREWAFDPVPTIAGIDVSWVDAVRRSSERIESLSRGAMNHTHAATGGAGAVATLRVATNRCVPVELTIAVELLRREKYQDALDVLSAVPEEAEDRDTQLLRAVLLTNSGNIAAAEGVCRRVLACDELNAGAHYLGALCREHAHDPKGAMEHDEAAIYLDPTFAMPHLHLGLLTKRAGNVNSAREELQQASTLLLREDASRVLLFGGGFSREALIEFTQTQLRACGGPS